MVRHQNGHRLNGEPLMHGASDRPDTNNHLVLVLPVSFLSIPECSNIPDVYAYIHQLAKWNAIL